MCEVRAVLGVEGGAALLGEGRHYEVGCHCVEFKVKSICRYCWCVSEAWR